MWVEEGRSGSRHVPVFESPDDLLEEDDSVSNGLVPLHLQQHVMVVLEGRAPEQWPPEIRVKALSTFSGIPGLGLGWAPQAPGPALAPRGSLSQPPIQRGVLAGQMEQGEPNLTGGSQRVQWAYTLASSLWPSLPEPVPFWASLSYQPLTCARPPSCPLGSWQQPPNQSPGLCCSPMALPKEGPS